jgi:hypothetical protein
MELLVPSLIALLAAVAIAYFFIPKVAPTILIAVSCVVLAWALYTHYQRFGVSEYERSNWIYTIRDYSGFILFGVIILGGFGFYVMNSQTGGISESPLPNLTTPVSGGGMTHIMKTVKSRMTELMTKGRITID